MEIFKRKFSELSGGRFDPLGNFTQIKASVFESVLLDKIATFNPSVTEVKNKNQLISFIPMSSVSNEGFIIEKNDKNLNELRGYTYFAENDIIIAKITPCMENGKCALAKNLKNGIGMGSTEFNVIRNENPKILNEFLFLFLNREEIRQEAQKSMTGSTGHRRVPIDFYKNLLIPLPPIPTQEKIIALMDKAYQQKEAKEKEAKALLNSIDSYLMQELGIKLPNKNYTSLKQRIFTQKLSKVSSTRLDPNYHQSYYQDLEKALSQSAYPLVSLSQIIKSFQKGVEVGSKAYSKNNKIPFIRVSDIDNNGINYEKVEKFICASLYENLKEFKPKKDELLYSKDGTIGICLKADTSRDFIISSAILRLEFKEKINIDFVQNILASHLMNVLANAKAIGAVIKYLNIGEFLSLKIPLPPLEIQEKIALNIEQDKQKAKILKTEAQAILKSAKIDIEKYILSSGGGGFNC